MESRPIFITGQFQFCMTVQLGWPPNFNFGSSSSPLAYCKFTLMTSHFRLSQPIKYFRAAWSQGRSSLLIWFNKLSLLVHFWIKNDSDWQRENTCWGETILLNWYFIQIKRLLKSIFFDFIASWQNCPFLGISRIDISILGQGRTRFWFDFWFTRFSEKAGDILCRWT